MVYFKFVSFYCFLFFVNIGFAQDIKQIPDSLKKYSYDDLSKIIDKKWQKGEATLFYSKVFLLKAKQENNYRKIISDWVWMGIEANDFETNIKYSDSAIALAKKKIPEKLAELYWGKANIFYSQKRLKEALNCYLIANQYPNKSIEMAENINFYIGVIKSTQGEYQEAIAIFKKCEEHPNANAFADYPRYLLALSENYNRINQIKISNEYITKGIAVCSKTAKWKIYLMFFISNRGKNEYKLKHYNKALQDLSSQLKPIREFNDYSNYAENCFFIGECYREQQQNEKAIPYYKKVDSIFTAKNDIYPIIIPAYEHLIAYYKKKQDYKQVIYYSDQFIKADKVVNDNYKYLSSKIVKTYDIEKIMVSKLAIISNLNSDKKMSTFTIILLIGLLAVTVLFFYNYSKKKQKELFDAYKAREEEIKKKKSTEKVQNSENSKKLKASGIDEKVITNILECFQRFEKELRFLDKECDKDLLATEFNTNSTYLSRVLTDIKNTTFTLYINSLRIEYIVEKLENDKEFLKYTIQYLSEISGYNNTLTFARAFEVYTKMKPSDFINQLKIRNIEN
jgi:AraC-like DNA-binding protein